jgi:hypothetical protein
MIPKSKARYVVKNKISLDMLKMSFSGPEQLEKEILMRLKKN